jgi:hypothetical protein
MFGKLIYKYNEKENLYLCSSSNLKGVEMWKYNRPHDQARVEEIKSYIDKTGVVDGIIYLAEIEQGGCIKYVCYDGNHRRLALKEMGETKVLVNLLLDADDEMIKNKFVALNQANPVPELYMIEGDEEMLEKVKSMVNDVVRDLVKMFPKHVSTSKKPKRPNFNRDMVVDQLGTFIMEGKLYDLGRTELAKKLLELNIKYMSGYNLPKRVSKNILDKCKKNRCYLFLHDFVKDLEV